MLRFGEIHNNVTVQIYVVTNATQIATDIHIQKYLLNKFLLYLHL